MAKKRQKKNWKYEEKTSKEWQKIKKKEKDKTGKIGN